MYVKHLIGSKDILLLFMIMVITGCAETKSYRYVNEAPPHYENGLPTYWSQHTQPVFDINPVTSIDPDESIDETPRVDDYSTLWERLFDLYALPEIDHPRVNKEIERYLEHPEYLEIIQKRAEPYLYFIVEQIEARQIPGEIALLPVIESAFRPQAMSSSQASGLWQFIPSTGRLLGLEQNHWYDGRMDVYASTQAAAEYLNHLNEEFDNDWLLALAAYNAGKGTISRAIQSNIDEDKDTDFWSLGLRQETMDYVPRLLAIAKIFAHAENYHISLRPIRNEPLFNVVKIEQPVDLKLAAELSNLTLQEFSSLNPGFKRWMTAPDSSFHVLVHKEKSTQYRNNLAKAKITITPKWIKHKVKSGENLGLIAQKHSVTVASIQKNNHLDGHMIKVGQELVIPVLTQPQPNVQKHKHKHYVVKKGDTFWDIARQFSISSDELAKWNNLSKKDVLKPGQKLIIKES